VLHELIRRGYRIREKRNHAERVFPSEARCRRNAHSIKSHVRTDRERRIQGESRRGAGRPVACCDVTGNGGSLPAFDQCHVIIRPTLSVFGRHNLSSL
jgi:hypothetical protein